MKTKKIGIALLILVIVIPVIYLARMQYQKHLLANLGERAAVYWDARKANDLVTAYQLEASAASGNMLPDEVEQNRYNGIRIIEIEIGPSRFTQNGGEVDITVTTNLPFSPTLMKAKQPDHWTLINGEWFHGYPEKGGSGLEKDPAPGVLKSAPSFLKGKS